MPGHRIITERRERWAALKQDTDFAAECIERVALGDSIRALAAEHDVPYLQFWRWMTAEHGETLAYARKANAALLAESNADMATKVERGQLDPKRAASAAKIREWLATRYDRDTFGDRSAVDMRVSGSVQMNLEAVRQLTQQDEQAGSTYDAEEGDWTEVDEHPLL